MTVLEADPDGVPRRSRSKLVPLHTKRFGNGVVQRTLVRFLDHGKPMHVRDIRAEAEKLLGQPVSMHSVSWCLRMEVRADKPWVERVKLGWYRLGDLVGPGPGKE